VKVRSILLGAVLVAAPIAVAPVAAAAPSTVASSPCVPGTPATAPPTTEFYDPARPYLGPAELPASPLMFFYRRFGSLTADAFTAKYRSGNSWIYPPADGFLVLGGKAIRYKQKLTAGTRIDRYGYPGGAYLAPARTLFLQRALPPQNLNTPVGTPQSNYHLYCVLMPFDVEAGPIAPWFEQPGLGLQYKLETSYLPVGAMPSVSWLIAHGYLVEERPA
jgi:hypothetical protein